MVKSRKWWSFLLSVSITALVALVFGITFHISNKSSQETQKLLQSSPDFMSREYRDGKNRVLRYRLLTPLNGRWYDKTGRRRDKTGRKFPLVIFLGGTSERGSNNITQLRYAGPFFERPDNRKLYPCFVVIPQCPATQNWVSQESGFNAPGCAMVAWAGKPTIPLSMTMNLINRLKQNLSIDSKRIYLMG